MTLEQYVPLALRTCKSFDQNSMNILHAEMGVCTEIGEIVDIFKRYFIYGKEMDKKHLAEELGDLSWYGAIAMHFHGVTREILMMERTETGIKHTEMEMLVHILSQRLIYAPYACFLAEDIATTMGLDYPSILQTNIEKLKVRYPDKYSDDKALNRDLDSERRILQT